MPTRVIVLGGGVAGMSAAHELIERGFEVVVLEAARLPEARPAAFRWSTRAPTPADISSPMGARGSIGHRVPGEHGFRFFPGFYKHVVDTMRRTPSFDGTQGGGSPSTDDTGRMHAVREAHVCRSDGVSALAPRRRHARCAIFCCRSDSPPTSPPTIWHSSARACGRYSPRAAASARGVRATSWWDFVGAEQRSASYREVPRHGHNALAGGAKARKASTRTIGDIFVQLVLTILNPSAGSTDRVLDGPTNLVWIDPWLAVSRIERRTVRQGRAGRGNPVRERTDHRRPRSPGRPAHHRARRPLRVGAPDRAHYRPGERPAGSSRPDVANLRALAANVEWMNGVQFYLRRAVPSAHGHVVHIDTEWALTSISQLQFWRNVPPELFGDSEVHGILSVDISDWTAPGSNGRPAMQCSREEVVRETWNQLKRSLRRRRRGAARRGSAFVVP